MGSPQRVPYDAFADDLTVIKVGGSLLGDRADLKRIAGALAERRESGTGLLVVVSALKGVTDLLERAALQALDDRRPESWLLQTVDELRHRHEALAETLPDVDQTRARIECILNEVGRLLERIRRAGRLSNQTYCRLLSSGERLSVPLMAAAIREAGQPARAVTARDIGLRARGLPRAGSCDLEASREAFGILRSAMHSAVQVLTGFYGIDAHGDVILFGRGGSDDTACAVAAGLGADRLELWKDVQGFMSADPKEVAAAHLVPELSFDEVAQLGAYGSSIVHHGCLEPLWGHRTNIFICSVNGTVATGTRLVEKIERANPGIVAFTAARGRTKLRLPSRKAGDAGRALTALIRHGVKVKGLDCRDDVVALTLATAEVEAAIAALSELFDEETFEIERFPALIAAVGDGVADDPEVRTELLACLQKLDLGADLTARPAGRSGLSFTVREETLLPALIGLHERFFTARHETLHALPGSVG